MAVKQDKYILPSLFLIIIWAVYVVFQALYRRKTVDIVIARYEEDISWVNTLQIKYSNIYIYNKGSDFTIANLPNIHVIKLPNIGRESHTYLYHVINNFNTLPDMTIFIPGSVLAIDYKREKFFKLMKSLNHHFESTIVGDINKEANDTLKDFTIDTYKITNENNRRKNPNENLEKSKYRPFGKWFETHFPGEKLTCVSYNGIIAATRKSIQKRSLDFYKTLLDEHSTPNPEVVHYSERAWETIFSIDKCVPV